MIYLNLTAPPHPLKPHSILTLEIRDVEDHAYKIYITGAAWSQLIRLAGPVEASLTPPTPSREAA